MKRERIPVTLRHDDGRVFTITHVRRLTGSAVATAARKQWATVEQAVGGPITMHRVAHDPATGVPTRVAFRDGPWMIDAARD